MSASSSAPSLKKPCVTCNKSGGIMTCDGCQQSFCGKHATEHRQQLNGQLDQIIQDYDLLQEISGEGPLKNHALLEKIDRWEVESVAKIRLAAEKARANLQAILEESKRNLRGKMDTIGTALRVAREADDYSEVDLNDWLQQLKEIQKKISSSSEAEFVSDKESTIHLIAIEKKPKPSTIDSWLAALKATAPPTKQVLKESFFQTLYNPKISDGNLVATHGYDLDQYVYMWGGLAYHKGCHNIRFKIEKSQEPYRIFFGCMSSKQKLKENAFNCPETVGWFGFDQVYEHGRCCTNVARYGYKSSMIGTNDYLQLILDCDQRKIRLFNERQKTACELQVNIQKAPLPWQFLVVLYHSGDSVRIVPNVGH